MNRSVLLVVGAMVTSHVAGADPTKDADALFTEGQRLIDAKEIDAACEKFGQSLELEPALGTRLNLADCRERQGRFVDAYQLYVVVAEEAGRSGKQSQLQFAKKRIEHLSQKVVRLTLRVADPTIAGLAIKVGDREIVAADWTRPLVLVAGEVVVDARATDRTPFHAAQTAAAGSAITIDIPALARISVATTPSPRLTGHRSWTPWIVGGAGGASLLVSVILGLHAKSVYNDALDKVTPDGDSEIERAKTQADVATAFAIVGTIGVGVGVYLYLRERRSTAVVPVTDGHGVGATLVGVW